MRYKRESWFRVVGLAAAIAALSTSFAQAAQPTPRGIRGTGSLRKTITHSVSQEGPSAPSINETPLPDRGGSPYAIAVGSDESLWYATLGSMYVIGRISPDGILTEFPIAPIDIEIAAIAAGPDGNLWFTAADFDIGSDAYIGRITPAGVITEFRLANSLSAPCDITVGPDRNLWFTECNINGNAIVRITPAGLLTEFRLPTNGPGFYPGNIASGSDGKLWFTEPYVKRIGSITTEGLIKEFDIPTGSTPGDIVGGSDGNVWFAEYEANRIARMTTTGVFEEFAIPTAGSGPRQITAGPNGHVWFTEYEANKIARITTAGLITEFDVPTKKSGPAGITTGPYGDIWFTELKGNRIGSISLSVDSSNPVDLSVGLDDKTRVLRFNVGSGQMALDSVDVAGFVSPGAPFEPYQGWTARAAATGADGVTRVLWTRDDGSASLWLVGSEGKPASFQFGPMSGWTAVDVAAGIRGTTHLLWTHTDGEVALWSVDDSGLVLTSTTYGPYQDWAATAISDGADGLTRLLWKKADGTVGLSAISSEGIIATHRYGPAGGWNAIDLGVGGDNQTRILWSHSDGRVALGVVNETGDVRYGPSYSSPVGLTARRVAAGRDGSARVLFTDDEGGAALWLLSPAAIFQRSFDLAGPTPSGSIAGTWTGTFDGISPACHSSAEATFQQAGSDVKGTMTVSCLARQFVLIGTFGANTFAGTALWGDPEFFPLNGTLSGSSLEMTIFDDSDSGGKPMGQLHLRRQ